MTAQRTIDATYFEQPEPQIGPVLRPKEASAYVGLAVATLAQRRCDGLPPRFVRLTRKSIGYLKSDLDSYLQTALCQSTADRPRTMAA
jgi:predicted DNA-binding transcriptional regulator AlpA